LTAGPNTKLGLRGDNDARIGMPLGIPRGAMCVQRFDDSLNSAIHITYRISLRSSSMPEPRDPLLKVLNIKLFTQTTLIFRVLGPLADTYQPKPVAEDPEGRSGGPPKQHSIVNKGWEIYPEGHELGNDPSAGSPTETLLRLLLPLNDQVWTTFRP
jgi:hypothetical protein